MFEKYLLPGICTLCSFGCVALLYCISFSSTGHNPVDCMVARTKSVFVKDRHLRSLKKEDNKYIAATAFKVNSFVPAAEEGHYLLLPRIA